MFRPLTIVLVSILWNYASAHNVETRETFPIYLRNGGSSYNASQEPAYAGYSFDVRLKGNVTHIIVGQPRSGVEGSDESPGALFSCEISSYIGVDETTAPYLATTPATTDVMLFASGDTTESPFWTTGVTDSTVITTTAATPIDFNPVNCTRIEVFDQTDFSQRGTDHKNRADSLGLNIARIGDTEQYAVCAPLRQRQCPKDTTYSPGACYYGRPDENSWNFLKWNETECFNQIIEIIFVVDGSSSISSTDFLLVKKWLINVAKELIATFGDSVRTEVLQYSNKDQARYNIPIGESKKFSIPYTLTDALPIEEIETRIKNMLHLNSQTYTHYALRRVMEWEFLQSEFYNVSKKMVVVLTDGEANDATRLSGWYNTYKDNITSFAVGVGEYRGFMDQLKTIANGDTSYKRVMTVGNFDELQNVVSTLTEQIESSASTEGTSSSSSKGAEEDTRNRQLGTAIASDKNGTLYFGAVGMYQDSGMVMKFDDLSESNPNEPTLQQVADALPDHTDDSYMGYTVVTGFFDGVSGPEYIATGAPRYKLLGAVVIYKPVKDDGALRDHVTLMAPNGEIASYFGGCLLSLDVSGDGKDDLFVGSPLYVEPHHSKLDEGRVFVYISQETNSSNIWGGDSFRPIELSGDHSKSGRFGMAMANAGDLNLDGFNDVVIGAPLADDGQGAVFIYDGIEGGISKEPSQKIHASTFSGPTLKYFGQSLQGNIDVDGNKYPDIFVGAPRSDSIVMLRSRPIVKMYSTIEYTTVDVNIFECITKNYTNCTSIKVCLHANGTSVESSIGIRYNLTIDVGKTFAVEKRLEFPTTGNKTSTTVQLNTNQDYCFTKALNMKSGVARETRKSTMDYEAPVISTIEFDLLPSHINTPFSSVRDSTLANSNNASIYFAKECVNLICVPDLQLTGDIILPSRTIIKNGTSVDLTENGDVLIIDTSTRNKKTVVRMNVTNLGENSFETKLRVTYHSNTPISKVRTISGFPKSTQCIIEDGSPISQGLLRLQEFRYNHDENIMTPNSTCFFEFDMSTDALKDNGEMGNFTVKALVYSSSKSSVEKDTTNNAWNETTRIKYKSDFALTKGRNPRVTFNYTKESENITSVGEIGNGTEDILVNFKIVDSGPSKIPLSEITFTWPWLTKELTPLLYLHKVECSEKSETAGVPSEKCVCDKSKVNPYNLITGENDPNGTSGQVTAIPASVNITSELLDCTNQTDSTHSCESLNCNISDLHQSEEVNFIAHFKLWTPSIRLDEKLLNEVKLQTDFKISSAKSPHIVGAFYNNTIVKSKEVVITAEKQKINTEPDYLWIYILAATGGTLLLAIILIIMWKCGFFDGNEYEKKMKEEQEKLDEELNFPDNSNANYGAEGHYQNHSDWDGKRKLDGDLKFVEESDAENGVALTDQQAINSQGVQSAAQLSQYDNLDGSVVDDEPDYDEPPDSESETADTDTADVILPPPADLDNEPDYDLPPDSQQKETDETENEPLPPPPPVESGSHSNVVLLEDEKSYFSNE